MEVVDGTDDNAPAMTIYAHLKGRGGGVGGRDKAREHEREARGKREESERNKRGKRCRHDYRE